MENDKNKKSVKFQGDMLNFYDFIQVFVFTTNHHLKDRKTGTVHELADVFLQDIIRYKKHLYKFRHQFNHYKELRSTLKQHEVLLHVDFSENYLCKTADEIQAMHFGASKPQIGLHTGIYYVGDKDGTTFATVSDSTHHSPATVWAHLDPVLDDIKIKFPQVETLHIFSDGLVTQYRQKGNFFLFSSEMGKKGFKNASWMVGWLVVLGLTAL